MSKIGSDHPAREAVVYIRQSTPDQLRNNHESRRRKYGLADRARGLGWGEPVIIDDDLQPGSGSSDHDRPDQRQWECTVRKFTGLTGTNRNRSKALLRPSRFGAFRVG